MKTIVNYLQKLIMNNKTKLNLMLEDNDFDSKAEYLEITIKRIPK